MKEGGRGTGCGPELLTLIIIASAVLLPLVGFFVLRLRPAAQRDLRLEWVASSERATAGDLITYTLTMYNVGVGDGLEVITVTDSLLGDLSSGFTSHLAEGTSDREVFTRTVLPGDPDPLTSTVVVQAVGAGEVFSATATASVDLLKPALRVEALVTPPVVLPGEAVTYTIAVANVGEVPVEVITVTDSLLGDLSASFAPTLAAGLTDSRDFAWTIPEDEAEPLRRSVTVHAAGAGEVLTEGAVAAVDWARPAVEVETTVSPAVALRGEEALAAVTISNAGAVDLDDVQVTDSLLGDVSASFPGVLAAGATAQGTFAWSVPADAPGPLSRTFTVTARAGGEEVSAADGIALALAGVDVDVSGAPWAAPGGQAPRNVTITNTSSVDAPDLILERVIDSGGDDVSVPDDCATLGHGEVCSFVYEVSVPQDEDSFTSGVDVRYGVHGFPGLVTASASHTAEVFQASVLVTLSGPAMSQAEERVSYVAAVTNSSSGEGPDLVLERAVDARAGELTVPEVCDVLPGGEACTFTYDSVVPAGEDPLLTTLEVEYRAEGLSAAVVGAASHSVEVFQPSISVSKTGPARGVEGEVVTYTIEITNTSSDDAPDLALESVRDSLGGDLIQPDGDVTSTCPERLSSGDACQIRHAYTLPAGGPTPLGSTVVVQGRPAGFSAAVTATAEHTMVVESPWERGTGLPGGVAVRALAVCPADAEVVYAGFGSGGRGVYRTEDGGETWAATGFEGGDVFGLAVDPGDCDRVYAGAWRDGVRKSEDGGSSWEASSEGLEGAFVYSVVVDPGDEEVLYAGTALRGVYRSEDGGAGWSPWGLEGLTVPHLSVTRDGEVVYAATWGEGVQRRERRGASWGTWAVVSEGIAAEHGQVYGVEADPGDDATVYAGTASGGLYRTLDGGGVWERVLPSPERVYAVAVDAGEGMVYAGTETGLYWSAAGGEAGSWQMMVAGPGERAVRCVAMGPEAAEYVHVGGADGVYRGRR